MTSEESNILERINAYADQVLDGIDPQKTLISVQLEKLTPILKSIATEKNISLEDMFILYMDLASQSAVIRDQKFKAEFPEK